MHNCIEKQGDIIFDVVGNTSPFSMAGESSGYMITANGRSYLLECGSKVFPFLGFTGIQKIKGLFCSHSHEDHKRWFTDIVLFRYYNVERKDPIRLITSETVMEEYHKNSKGALERSLSSDSKRVVDIPFDDMVESTVIGPRSKYYIHLEPGSDGSFRYDVRDRAGNTLGPDRAKIVINPRANRPRLLFRDEASGEWVEPESYYPFSSTAFYEKEPNPFRDDKAGLTVTPIKASVWHGVPTIGFRFECGPNRLIFSGDTVYKPSLWKTLCEEHRPQSFHSISRGDFASSRVIYGDINDFIERTWSRERYDAALSAYDGAIVIHDVARKNSVVHTDYADIAHAPIDKLIFTHNPDNLTTLRPILHSRQQLIFRDGEVYDCVCGRLHPFDADVYIRHFSGHYVGYRAEQGAYKVIEEDGLLGIAGIDHPDPGLFRVDLYEDLEGEYYPVLGNVAEFYRRREDGKVEIVFLRERISEGRVVESARGRIEKSSPTDEAYTDFTRREPARKGASGRGGGQSLGS